MSVEERKKELVDFVRECTEATKRVNDNHCVVKNEIMSVEPMKMPKELLLYLDRLLKT